MKRIARQLYVQMIVGIVAGALIGHVWPAFGVSLAPLGIAFVKAMRMMVPPILFCTIVDGIVAQGGARQTGSTVARALIVFLAITVLALLCGLLVAGLLRPGANLTLPRVIPHIDIGRALGARQIDGPGDFLLRMVPDTSSPRSPRVMCCPCCSSPASSALACCASGRQASRSHARSAD